MGARAVVWPACATPIRRRIRGWPSGGRERSDNIVSNQETNSGEDSPRRAAGCPAQHRQAYFRDRGGVRLRAAGGRDVLLWANLRGVDSHGVVRVPRYIE